MKIIIDLPEARYKDIQRIASVQLESHYFKTAEQIIANGTPLPKEHRFIDADEILNHAFITEDEEGDIFVRKYYCIKKEVMDNALVLFDTLEADKTESEEV